MKFFEEVGETDLELNREIKEEDAEVNRGKSLKATLAVLSQDYTRQVAAFKAKFIPSLTQDQLYLTEDPFLEQLDVNEENTQLHKAYVDAEGDFPTGEKIRFATEHYDPKTVVNAGAFKKLKKGLKSYIGKVEDMLAYQLYDEKDEYGCQLAIGFARASGVGDINRMLRGHSSAYLTMRTPMADAVDGLVGTVNPTMDAGYTERLKVNEPYYPLISVIIGAEKHLQTLSDYWAEQENGTLQEGVSAERDLLYKQKLYDQAKTLIPLIDKMSAATMDEDTRAKIKASGLHSKGNEDPFHNSLYSSRGALQLKCTLQAHMAGLENGWLIDDLGFLAAFNFLRVSERNACLCRADTEKLEQFERYEKPRYKEGQKEYLDKLDQIFTELQRTRLTGADDRKTFIKAIKQNIDEGVKKGLIDEDKVKYFNQMYFNATCRDYHAGLLLQNPAYRTVVRKDVTHDEVELDLSKPAFTTERSWIFFGRESNAHKKLRDAAESLRQMEEDRRDPLKEGEITTEEYLNKLDEVVFLARTYREKNKGAHTGAGRKRLEGAEKYETYADEQRRKLLQEMMEKNPDEKLTMEEMRIRAAKKMADRAKEKLDAMQQLPADAAGKQKCMEYAADILAHKFAVSDNEVQKEGFMVKGFNNIKKDLLSSSQFSRMMNEYFTRNAKPSDLANDMLSDKGMGRLQDLHRQIKNEMEKRRNQIRDKVLEVTEKNVAADRKKKKREAALGGM